MSNLYRATEDGVCTSLGGLLSIGDDYTPQIVSGVVHPEDAAHIANGRLAPADDRKVDKKGALIGKLPAPPTNPEPATGQEA